MHQVDTSYVQKNESTCMIGYFCCDFCEDAILATASEKKLNVATEWSDTSFLMIDEKRKRRILHIDFESSRGTSYDITTLPLHLQSYRLTSTKKELRTRSMCLLVTYTVQHVQFTSVTRHIHMLHQIAHLLWRFQFYYLKYIRLLDEGPCSPALPRYLNSKAWKPANLQRAETRGEGRS